MRPGLPPRLRRRLADTILAARHDEAARHQLHRLGSDNRQARDWCAPDDGAYGELVRERASRAAEALRGMARCLPGDLDEALEAAAVLFDAGLFFEAHEALEPHWRRAEGDTRQVLQGLIQIAVGYEHWVHGNLHGARALLEEGSARLQGRQGQDLDLERFGTAVAVLSRRVKMAPPVAPPFPRRHRNPRQSG